MAKNFITEIVRHDVEAGKYGGRVHTRFPPEPNGHLHIGHVKAIAISFDIARKYGGKFNLRFDDTNPVKEEQEYVESIRCDIRWLGVEWEDRLYFASDYFERFYECAVRLVEKGHAYVDSLSADEIREYRGTPTEPGRDSPYRNRRIEENLEMLRRMRAGDYGDGDHILRAKIDMAHPNLVMRDPPIYRIRHQSHQRTHGSWCIYPMYDFAHCLSDAQEEITHSFCTLEFEGHRPLYDWFLEMAEVTEPPVQIEFARLNITHTVLSKRRLARLVEEGDVAGWDDPRMPTIAGMRRRGYSASALLAFCRDVGVTKTESLIDFSHLEFFLREEFNAVAPRVMAVLKPLKVIIDNYPEGQVEQCEAIDNPEDPDTSTRKLPFSKEIYIEQDDFHLEPPPKYHRLAIGREVRLMHAYAIVCHRAARDEQGNICALHCTYDPNTSGGHIEGRKVKGTIHWVSASHAVEGVVRLYDRLFLDSNPLEGEKEGRDYRTSLNPDSCQVHTGCKFEPSLAEAACGRVWQFLRHGYFCLDDSAYRDGNGLIFNRTVSLRDRWARVKNRST